MIRPRVIPVLLMRGGGLYKTQRFAKPTYVGDPINTMRIFNDKEVDEIILLDITATKEKRGPDFERIRDIVSESFMPLAYGGGISTYDQAMRLFDIGVEKIVVNTAAFTHPALIEKVAAAAGSQAVVASMDVRKGWLSGPRAFVEGGKRNTGIAPVEYTRHMADCGAGEIMVTSIVQEGMMQGYDVPLLEEIAQAVEVPVIAHGGAGNIEDFRKLFATTHVSAVAAGSLFVFQGPHRAVLISYPSPQDIEALRA